MIFEVLLRSLKYSPEGFRHLGDIRSIDILMIDCEIAIHHLPHFDLIVLHNRRLDCLIYRRNKRKAHIIYIHTEILAKGAVESSSPKEPIEVTQAAPT